MSKFCIECYESFDSEDDRNAHKCDEIIEKRKLKWNEFVGKYHALLEEYDVSLDWGCGCCRSYHTIGGGRADYEGFDRA